METLNLSATDKAGRYREVLPQLSGVISAESDLIANLANAAAILKEAFGFFWVGFYLVKPSGRRTEERRNAEFRNGEEAVSSPAEEYELVLGPFQGPLACTRIAYGRGVCGTAWKEGRTFVVPDVDLFPGHIACSSLSRSEIVVPVFAPDGEVAGVLDIDSREPGTFDEIDREYLEQAAGLFSKMFAELKK